MMMPNLTFEKKELLVEVLGGSRDIYVRMYEYVTFVTMYLQITSFYYFSNVN